MKHVKKFLDVFGKIPLSGNDAQHLSKAFVNTVRINKENKTMKIALHLDEIVNESCFFAFERGIRTALPFITDVSLQVNYALDGMDACEKISRFWESLVIITDESSPLCARILGDSNWEITGNRLVIWVKHNGSFIFKKKGLDKKIQATLAVRLGIFLSVHFEDVKADENVKQEYTSEIIRRETEMLKKIIAENSLLSVTSVKIPVTKIAAQKPQYDAHNYKPRIKGMKINSSIAGQVKPLSEELMTDTDIIIEGEIFELETKETRSGKYIVSVDISDGKDSVTVKFFTSPEKFEETFRPVVKKGNTVRVKGKVQFDDFTKEINIMASELGQGASQSKRMDESEEKRVELHLHTQMSSMDAINTATEYIKRAAEWGHRAIAITDHGVVQAYPEAMEASRRTGVKVIYGVEAYLIDDLGVVVQCARDQRLDGGFVVFDIETTGLSKETNKIIEIGAVKICNRQITDRFSAFINPNEALTQEIINLTHITDDMLTNAPQIEEVLPKFLDFIGDSVLVAHNASFDVGFIAQNAMKIDLEITNTVLDTVGLSRMLFPQLSRHKLDVVAKYLDVRIDNHHRAIDDANATAEIFLKCVGLMSEQGISTLHEINLRAGESVNKNKLKTYHAIILVKNQIGLRNLYELVSKAHINYFFKRPRIPKSEYIKLREGLIIGTACEAGEFYKAVRDNKPADYIRELADFYDFFEIQPNGNNQYMIRNGTLNSIQDLININKKIVALGEKYNKPVVATCDVHFMNPEDEVYRRIIMAGDGFKDADNQPPLFYRTTEEMLAEFSYLGAEKAREVVITATNAIADSIENVKPIPDETFPPKIDGAEKQLTDITMTRARELYGEELPTHVADRLERELESIIKNGFSVMYIIAQKLVWKSMSDGYLVGSRGSVGSSLVATMAGITEVNPLPAHYLCLKCQYSDFDSEDAIAYAAGAGYDMPDKNCPVCGTKLNKDGHNIPFETFLGFDGDKEPDIDLNFSGEYQAKAHAYTEELFGEGHVFKAGTIGTLADKTAYGYVKKYLEERNIPARSAQVNWLKNGCTGIKRTTGQHPGGLMIVPEDKSIYEFCPIQRPANDQNSNVTTTHFDYHSISGRLLKLDLLGHDVPTIIRMLHDITGVDPQTVDLGDKATLSLFTSTEALNVIPEDINCKTGTLGLPEFGTSFVRQMLLDTQPSTFSELVRISGLSHGTDVWFNNAHTLISDGVANLKEVISGRDDIMVYLISKGVDKLEAFKIMENVRKGKSLTEKEETIMEEADVPDWYIESCRRIKYLFPKGHAVAYVMMTVRIGYFKINYPYSFYAASFSVKSEDFDYELMCFGRERVQTEIIRINNMGKEASAKEKNTLTIAELVIEMYTRGLSFVPLDLYKAEATKFMVTDSGLMAPLCSIQGLGTNAAQNIVSARKDGEFITIEDFKERTRVNKTVIELLKKTGILSGLSETSQLSLF